MDVDEAYTIGDIDIPSDYIVELIGEKSKLESQLLLECTQCYGCNRTEFELGDKIKSLLGG